VCPSLRNILNAPFHNLGDCYVNPPKDPARAAELAERIIAIADSSVSQALVQFVNEFIQSREGGFLSLFVCGAGHNS
jgi:hypothetical protein